MKADAAGEAPEDHLPAPLRLQVRTMDGDCFWIDTDMHASVLSCKLSIQEARGMHVCMQKLICLGRVLADDVARACARVGTGPHPTARLHPPQPQDEARKQCQR